MAAHDSQREPGVLGGQVMVAIGAATIGWVRRRPRQGSPLGAREFHDETCPRKERSSPTSARCAGRTSASMKITQDVRDYAAKHGIAEETAAIAQGLRVQ